MNTPTGMSLLSILKNVIPWYLHVDPSFLNGQRPSAIVIVCTFLGNVDHIIVAEQGKIVQFVLIFIT